MDKSEFNGNISFGRAEEGKNFAIVISKVAPGSASDKVRHMQWNTQIALLSSLLLLKAFESLLRWMITLVWGHTLHFFSSWGQLHQLYTGILPDPRQFDSVNINDSNLFCHEGDEGHLILKGLLSAGGALHSCWASLWWCRRAWRKGRSCWLSPARCNQEQQERCGKSQTGPAFGLCRTLFAWPEFRASPLISHGRQHSAQLAFPKTQRPASWTAWKVRKSLLLIRRMWIAHQSMW